MSFLSHLGATAYKYEIELVLVNLRLSALSTSPLWVEWKRGRSNVKSPPVSGDRGVYDFGKRAMRIESTMFQKKGKFQKKESRLTVKQTVKGREVVVGYIDVDLKDYVKTSDVSESMTLNLQKCSDKMARLTFRLNTHWLRGAEINSDDEMSRSTNFSTIAGGGGGESLESSVNESPASRDVNDLDALEGSDDDESDEDERRPAAAAAKTATTRDTKRTPVPDSSDHSDDDDDDEDEEDARRRVKFSKKSLGRTSRGGEGDPATAAAPPKKSSLKNPSASPPAPKASSRAPPPASSDSEADHDHAAEDDDRIPLFGVRLDAIMASQAESFPDLDVPIVLDVVSRGLERGGGLTTEGLFRVSPLNRARDDLRAAFERGEYQLPKDATISAALLKHWFGELAEPLFPEKLNPAILEIGKTAPAEDEPAPVSDSDSDSDEEYQRRRRKKKAAAAAAAGGGENAAAAEALRAVLVQLPALNARVLARLVSLLTRVAAPANAARNKMGPRALAVVFAPNLVRLPTPDPSRRAAAEQIALDTRRAVNFIEHVLRQAPLVEAVGRGEVRASTSPPAAKPLPLAAATSVPAAAATKKKPPSKYSDIVGSDDEEDPSTADHTSADDHDDPIPSFAHSVDLGSELSDEEPQPPARGAAAKAAKAKKDEEDARKRKQQEEAAAEAEASARRAEEERKSAAAAAAKKKNAFSDDESEEEEAPRPSRRSNAAAAAASKAAPKSSPPTANGRRGRPVLDDSDDSDEEDAKRADVFRRQGIATSANGAAAEPSVMDQLFARKSTTPAPPPPQPPMPTPAPPAARASAGARRPPPPDDSDTETGSDEEPPAPEVKNQLFAKKAAQPAAPAPPPPQPKKASTRATFGEESDEDDFGNSGAGNNGRVAAAASSARARDDSDSDSEEEVVYSPRRASAKQPPPPPPVPVPSPSPRSAIAALSTQAAARSNAREDAKPPSPSVAAAASAAAAAASAELAALRAQVATLQQEKSDRDHRITELEEESERAAQDAEERVSSLEKDLRRVKSENADLARTVEATSVGTSSSKQVEALKKQVSALLAEKEDALADYDELEAKYTELRRTAADHKKQAKAHQSEMEDLRDQLAEAQAAAARGGKPAAAAAASRNGFSASGPAGSLAEEKLREEYTLLQLQFEEVRSELTDRLESEKKLTKSLQVQLATLRIESDQLRAREVRFDELTVLKSHIDPKKNAKDKLQMDLIAAYEESQKRGKFLVQQLKECDATLLHAKQGWAQTVQVLQDQIAAQEAEIEEYKRAAADANAQQPFDQQQFEYVQKKLRKSEQARSKLSELLASHESELTKKKLELKTALQSILDLQADNARIKEDLVRSGMALKTIADDNFELKEFLRLNTKGKK